MRFGADAVPPAGRRTPVRESGSRPEERAAASSIRYVTGYAMATIDDIALTLHPRLGKRGAVHLLDEFGSAEAVYAASADELVGRAELREDIARSIVAHVSHSQAERELKYCRRNGIGIMVSTDDDYPEALRDAADYPHVLYIKGNRAALSGPMLTMVGTRRISQYGVMMCEKLVAGLAERLPSLTVVSGLAFGVDVNCHRAALRHGLPTAGVVANALPEITPAHHTAFARDMIDSGGVVVSELHSQTKQNGRLYIERNRIMAAISRGTVVVEAPVRSGSLSTVSFADGYQHTVMAVPGRVGDRNSEGCNALIANRRAQLISSADDIVREMMWDVGEPACRPASETARLPEAEGDAAKAFDCFANAASLSEEELSAATGFDTGRLAVALLELELLGAVRRMPGNTYLKL